MRTMILLACAALLAFAGCTKEPDVVDIEELMDEILAEMDWHAADEDELMADEDTLLPDGTPVTDTGSDDDALLSDD